MERNISWEGNNSSLSQEIPPSPPFTESEITGKFRKGMVPHLQVNTGAPQNKQATRLFEMFVTLLQDTAL